MGEERGILRSIPGDYGFLSSQWRATRTAVWVIWSSSDFLGFYQESSPGLNYRSHLTSLKFLNMKLHILKTRDNDDAVLANVIPIWGNATIRAQCLSEDHTFQSIKFPSLYRQGSVFKPRDQAGSLCSHSGSCIFTNTGIWTYCSAKPSSPASLSQHPGQELVLISWPGRGSGAEHKARNWGPPGARWIKQMRDRAMRRIMTTKAPSHQGGGIVSFQPGYCQWEHRSNGARTSNSYLKELHSFGPHRNSANL